MNQAIRNIERKIMHVNRILSIIVVLAVHFVIADSASGQKSKPVDASAKLLD